MNFLNDDLNKFLMMKFNKENPVFSMEELSSVTDVVIRGSFNFKEIEYFKNLIDLTLVDMELYNSDFDKLNEMNYLKKIVFQSCSFESLKKISTLKIESLGLLNCDIPNFEFLMSLNNLNTLSVSANNLDINILNSLTNLKKLDIRNSVVNNIDKFNLLQVEELFLDDIAINDFSFVYKLSNLKVISISIWQYKKNEPLFINLKDKGVKIVTNGYIEIGGVLYD